MDDDSVLIEPRRIPGDPPVDHPVILNLFEPYFELLRRELKIKKSALKRVRFPSMTCCSTSIDGRKISVFGTPLGAPQAALMLERLIAMGAGKILSFGCCGSLQPALGVGSVVVPTEALCEEGTSAHYPLPGGKKGKADDEMVQFCLAKSRDRKINAVSGKVWTTDALFRETRGKTRKYSQEGILAVEMEMSALLTVAAYRGVRLGGFMVVSDELASLKWKTGFLNPFFWHASKKAVRLAIEIGCLL